MSWIGDLLQGIPLNAVLKERLAQAEQKFKDLETDNKKLKDHVAALTAENERLKKIVDQAEIPASFVPFRGVLWNREADGTRLPCCPKCKAVLARIPPGFGDFLRCKACNFDAPFHPDQVEKLAQALPK